MFDDPIVAEVRRIREEIAKQYNYDVRAIAEAARAKDKELGDRLVNLSAKTPESPAKMPASSPPARTRFSRPPWQF